MNTSAVVCQVHHHIATITLNRPNNRNSMTAELLKAFTDAVCHVRADKDLRCVVITGEGSCFSAGADLRSQLQHSNPALLPHERSFAMYKPFLSVLDIDVPVIGALNGHAVGGGFGLALVCDIRIGNCASKYGANFVRLGLHPGMAISHILPRMIGIARASELLFTGRLLDGQEASAWGILNEAVAKEDVLPRAMSLAQEIASNAPIAVRVTKQTLRASFHHNTKAAAYREAFAQAETIDTADCQEGIQAVLEKRSPNFLGR